GSDLREGVFTLPVLLTLECDPALGELLVEGIDEDGVAEVAERVRATGADRRSAALAIDHLQTAFAHLRDRPLLRDGTELLATIAERVLEPLERLALNGGPRARRAAWAGAT